MTFPPGIRESRLWPRHHDDDNPTILCRIQARDTGRRNPNLGEASLSVKDWTADHHDSLPGGHRWNGHGKGMAYRIKVWPRRYTLKKDPVLDTAFPVPAKAIVEQVETEGASSEGAPGVRPVTATLCPRFLRGTSVTEKTPKNSCRFWAFQDLTEGTHMHT